MPRRVLNAEWQLRRLPIITALGAAVAIAVLIVTLLIWFDSNSVSNREAQHFRTAIADNCDRENSTRAAVRRILTLAEDATLNQPHATSPEIREAVKFYSSALKLVPLINCGLLATYPSH